MSTAVSLGVRRGRTWLLARTVPALLCLLLCARAHAYEGPTTLAGIAERAAFASRLHRQLVERFGLPLGLYEPLRLDPRRLPLDRAQELEAQLKALDPAEGYAPEALPGLTAPPVRRLTALGWLMAGAVLETAPERLAHHFVDAEGRGLRRLPGQSAAGAALRAVHLGLSRFRDLMTGTAFTGEGPPLTAWLTAPDNDLGLVAFQRAYAQAVRGAAPEERETALVQALLAAGGMLALVGQAGDPAHVRNDLAALLEEGGPFARHVAERYGRAGVPEPAKALPGPAPRHLGDLILNEAGTGLAQRTARRFFSPRTLPGSGAPLPPSVRALLGEVPGRGVPLTEVPPRWPDKGAGYLGTQAVPTLAAWARVRVGERVLLRWSLDERCYDSYARVLLPEVGRYATAALDHLVRGDLTADWGPPRGERELRVRALGVALRGGTLTMLGEGEGGQRRTLGAAPVEAAEPDGALPLPALGAAALKGVRRLVLLYEGADDAGEPLQLSTQLDVK